MMGHTSGQWVYIKVSTTGLPANCDNATSFPNWSCSENAGAGTPPRSVPCKPDDVVGVESRPVAGAPVALRKPNTATTSMTSKASVITERREARRQFIGILHPSYRNNKSVISCQHRLLFCLAIAPIYLAIT